jgi:hypothetical protein
MNDPKQNPSPDRPDKDDDRSPREASLPKPRIEIPAGSTPPEIPAKPSRELPNPEPERALGGEIASPPPASPPENPLASMR